MLSYFNDPRFRFFLHIDQKIDLKAYLDEMDAPGRVAVVEPRIKVFWGGFSMIEAEISLIRAALEDKAITGLVLCSDDCAPLKSPDEIYQALMTAPDRIAREVRNYTQEWYHKFHFPDSNFTCMIKHLDGRNFEEEDWENIQRLERARRRGKKALKAVFFSRQWWALSRDSAVTMLRTLEEDEHLLESFRYSLFSDETLFATLHQKCFPDAKIPNVPMFADYERPPVPFIYTKPHELPEPNKLGPDDLFIRKIWPWSVDVVDRIAARWAEQVAVVMKESAAEPAADAAFQQALTAAIEARDDGDLEESLPLFEAALARWPAHPKASLEYAETLKKLRRLAAADAVLEPAIEHAPMDIKLRAAWAEVPVYVCDHDEVVRRGRIYRSWFPPVQYGGAWHSVAVGFAALSEMLRWDELARTVAAERDNATQHAAGLRICLWQATELCRLEEQKKLASQARTEAWGELPQEAKGNVRLRVELAELNLALVRESGVRVISIGQNCLPYLLGGRWGMLPARERPEETTPFDRGAFQKDNTATVIENDFATFESRGAYTEAQSWDQQRMYRHKPTGVYFYHERGKHWFDDDGVRFFAQIDKLVEKWREVSKAGRRLFVFCLCGEGDLARLVSVMADGLLREPDAHLLVVDVLQQPHECPSHERVAYLHIPYPHQYVWDDFYHQCEARGVGFELDVMLPMMDHMLSYLEPERAAFYREERLRILHFYAKAAVSWRPDHANGVALYRILRRLEPAERETNLAFAKALRHNGQVEEARVILAEVAERQPADYYLKSAWAESGVAPFDWVERLSRLRVLREQFPPESEPRTWETMAEELKILTEHGEWDEAVAMIATRWDDFTTRPNLFHAGLDTLIQLGRQNQARRLIEATAPATRSELSAETLAVVLQRLDQAEHNTSLLRQAKARVLVLGQNLLPGQMMTRWGLRGDPRTMNELTPFEEGEFFRDTAAEAIADNFTELSRHEAYLESQAWGGGVSLRHKPSGVTFMMHRTARIGEVEAARFFAHLDAMVAHWRRRDGQGRRIYLYFFMEKGDPERLMAAVKTHLLVGGDKLVIIDQHEEATEFAKDPDIVYLHAPQPRNYWWFSVFGSATPENIRYEQRVLAPVIEILQALRDESGMLATAPGEWRSGVLASDGSRLRTNGLGSR